MTTWSRAFRKRSVLVAATAALGLTTAGLSIGATAADAASSERPAQRTVATPFALHTSGYATKVKGGSIPASSGATAYDVIGCTNRAGGTRTNNVADTELPGLGTVSGAQTRLWTTSKGGTVSSWSRHTVGDIVLSDSPLGTLSIKAVSTTARAFHDAQGFQTETHTDIGRLSFAPVGGPAMEMPLPAPGKPVVIPGFATITLGHSNVHTNATSAVAYANGLKVELTASGTTVRVAHATASIAEGIKSGIFRGSASGLRGVAVGDVLHLGKNIHSVMPCQGTGGKVATKSAAALDLGGQIVVGAAKNSQMAKQSATKAWGYERSEVASVELGGGALKIDGIVGKAAVTRTGRHVARSTKGTTLGAITVNGEAQQMPDTGVLEIPGLARLEPGVVSRSKSGLTVVGLRITLLDGTGATIDLATARLVVRPA